ncbi:MAG TPA: sigma-54 dependent transcriptional regulator [Aridibacter sp.]|nr:sigma-54 dependent transcriptional regulator [Aridibacter sp.]
MAKILLADDEQQIRRMMTYHLEKEGHQVTACADATEALEKFRSGNFDLVITDLRMPRMSGTDLLREIRQHDPELPVIVLTAYASVESAVEAMKLGAGDYIFKPPRIDEITIKLNALFERTSLRKENRRLKDELERNYGFDSIIGESRAIKELIEGLRPLARDPDISVLITGESGTGKELVARALHYSGPRSGGRFAAVNCAAIPDALFESELFGHEKGSFTDARDLKKGMFETADGGTLFLDEISSIPLPLQAKLLRALEEKEIRRVGGTEQVPVDIRIIAATNADLEALSAEGGFRQDLFYRLAVARVALPPLRERQGDVRRLARHFLEKFNEQKGRNLSFSEDALEMLEAREWKGNVRELENLVEMLVVTANGKSILASNVPSGAGFISPEVTEQAGDFHAARKQVVEAFEREFLLHHLKKNRWNVSRTAEAVGISRRALHSKMNEYRMSEE